MVVASFCFWGGGVPFPAFVVSSAMGEDTTKAGKGTGVVIGKNKGQIMHTKLSACQLNIFRDRMVSLFGN